MTGELIQISRALANLEEEQFLSLVQQFLQSGESPLAIVEACREGMTQVGNRFAAQEYFVTDLLVSAEIFNSAMNLLGPHLGAVNTGENHAAIVVGTVQGDIHNIGKDLVVSLLRCSGFTVHDLGINVSPQGFIDRVRETGATVLGLSGLLTIAYPVMAETIAALAGAGLRDKVKVMIGGGMVDDFVCAQVGADAWGKDAVAAVRLARSFTGGK